METQPLISLKIPLLSILKRMMRVRGSSACSTVARSALSTTLPRVAACNVQELR